MSVSSNLTYILNRSHNAITTLFLTGASWDVSNSRPRAGIHFFAISSCCKHNFPTNYQEKEDVHYYFLQC